MKERMPGELICTSEAGKPHLPPYTMRSMKKVSELMGLKTPLTHHNLRSSFCTNLTRKDAKFSTVVKLARHKDGGKVLLKHYLKINMDDKWEALRLLDQPAELEAPAEPR